MGLTREEADANLQKALQDHAEAYDLKINDDDFLGDFIAICAWTPATDNGRTGCSAHYQRMGHTPQHIALGLLEVAHTYLVDDE